MSTTTTHHARISAIRDAAIVRQALGQAAQHELLSDGRHQVSLYDRTVGRLIVGIGATVEEAIVRVQEEIGR